MLTWFPMDLVEKYMAGWLVEMGFYVQPQLSGLALLRPKTQTQPFFDYCELISC